MLIKLYPGLVCKKCASRMELGNDKPGALNLVLNEDMMIKYHDFDIIISCPACVSVHHGVGFIRDSTFKGVYKYELAK